MQFKKLFSKFIIFGIICIILIATTYVLAQEKTVTNSATTSATIDEEKVKALKEKLATKVAEMRDSQTRGFSGEIAQISKTSFTLVTLNAEVKIKYTDDILIFKRTGENLAEAKLTDLKNSTTISTLGIYEKDLNQLTAKVIFLETAAKFYSGKISIVDTENGELNIKNDANKDFIIDYAKTTVAQEYDFAKETIIKSGMSKMVAGDRILVWGTTSEEDNQKIVAQKILRLSKDIFVTSTASPSASIEATPSATTSPKTSPKTTPKASPKTSPKASTGI